MNFGALSARLAHVRGEIARRQAATGWTHPVTIVAVTKGFELDAVEAALAAGLTDLGENRVQEALAKIDTPAGGRATWHLIGHLQRNKAKHVPGRFALVHSLDAAALAEELDRRAAAHGTAVRVLLQVNVAGETQKSGCAPGDAAPLARRVAALAHLKLEGLMTIAPFTDDVEVQRRTFRGLRALRDGLQEEGLWLPTLSMGMSADYGPALEEGATVIRLGTVLFGPRTTERAGEEAVERERGGGGGGPGVSGDAFHLTPHDVRKQEFRRTLRGYEPLGVEDFRARVADELERILREKSVLEERLAALGEQLKAYRERERAMNDALVAAQQLREATHTAAQREAQVVLREAEAEARRVLDAAGAAKADVERQAAEVQRQYQQYVGGFRALLERQLAELRALDGQRGG